MVSLRDTLHRFRPAAAPGAPGRRGVPVDRVTERESELAALFAVLAETEQTVAEIRRRAAVAAEELRCDTRRRAEAMVAEASVRAEALRAEAAVRARASVDQERDRAAKAAATVREQLGRRADARLPGLVARATALARAELDPPGAPPVSRQ